MSDVKLLYDKPLLESILYSFNIYGFSPFNINLFAKIRCCIFTIIALTCALEKLLGALTLETYKDLLFDIVAVIGYELYSFRLFILIVKRAQLEHVIKTIQEQYWKTNNQEEHSQIQRVYKILKMVKVVLYTALFSIVFSWFLNPSLIKNRSIPYTMYHVPKNNASLGKFLFVWTSLFVLHMTVIIDIYVGFDLLFVLLIVYNIHELKLIKKRFFTLQENSNEELHLLINQHNLVLNTVKELNNIFSNYMTNLLLCNIIINCLSLVNIIIQGFPPDVAPVMFIVYFLSTLFVFCFLGTWLSNEALEVADVVFKTDWWKKNKTELRKNLVLVIQRSQKPAILTAEPLTLNFKTFTQILKMTFNFFTFTRALLNKD